MPIDKYFKGSGDKVMRTMQARYGEKAGKSTFYATANKQKMKPADKVAKIKSAKAKTSKPSAFKGGPAPMPKRQVAPAPANPTTKRMPF